MTDFRAYNSRWRLALALLFAVGFVMLGFLLAGIFGEVPSFVDESRRRLPPEVAKIIGWVCTLFFGFVGLVIAKRFFENKPHLYVGSDGIISSTWSDQVIPWTEIIDVTVISYSGQKSIALHLQNPDHFPGRGLSAILDRVNRKFIGGDVLISVNGANRTHEEAMAAIDHFRGGASGNVS